MPAEGRQRTERAEPRRPPPTPAGPFLVNALRKHFARKKAPAAKTSGGGAPKGRFWGFIRSILSLCFVKKWGDCQISAKVTFIRAKLPKIPKFPILLARSNRMSESSVLLKSQPDRTRNADFLLLATFGGHFHFVFQNLQFPLLCLSFHSYIKTMSQK